MEEASVPAGKIYDAKDIIEDEHVIARGMVQDVTIGSKEDGRGWNLKVLQTFLLVTKKKTLIFFLV